MYNKQSPRLRIRGASPLSGSARDAHMGAISNLKLPQCGSCFATPHKGAYKVKMGGGLPKARRRGCKNPFVGYIRQSYLAVKKTEECLLVLFSYLLYFNNRFVPHIRRFISQQIYCGGGDVGKTKPLFAGLYRVPVCIIIVVHNKGNRV